MIGTTDSSHTLIVGGTKGAGREAVRMLLSEGGRVSVIARNTPKKSELDGLCAQYWAVDIADSNAVFQTVNDILEKNGSITSLVFFQRFRGDGESWDGEISISLTSTKKLIDWLVEKHNLKDCSIVIVSSINSRFISHNLPLGYHVGKAGLNQLVRYYAVTLGKRGIRVNSVSPATFLKEESQEFFLKNVPLLELYRNMIPIGRMCTAKEVVQPILFLTSTRSSFITGQDLIVDGGLTLQYQEVLLRDFAKL